MKVQNINHIDLLKHIFLWFSQNSGTNEILSTSFLKAHFFHSSFLHPIIYKEAKYFYKASNTIKEMQKSLLQTHETIFFLFLWQIQNFIKLIILILM